MIKRGFLNYIPICFIGILHNSSQMQRDRRIFLDEPFEINFIVDY